MKKKKIIGIIIVCLCAVLVGILLYVGNKSRNINEKKEGNASSTEVLTTSTQGMTTQIATTTEVSTTEQPVKKHIIVIDPGHQGPNVNMSATEPNAPGSSVMKQGATGGTTGRYTKIPEYQLNLDISLALRQTLEEKGYTVYLTREDNDTAISNMNRAKYANDLGADLSIRIHANGCEDSSVNGAMVLVGSDSNPNVGELYEDSNSLGETVLDAYCKNTGMRNGGVTTNDTMTGINWSTVPVAILEMGYMTNEQDDRNMADKEYQKKMVAGIAEGITTYCQSKDKDVAQSENGVVLEELSNELDQLVKTAGFASSNVSYYVKNLANGDFLTDKENTPMKAASLIKLFVAGCCYEQQEKLWKKETYCNETDALIKKMITVSDNEACNELVTRIGDGDAGKGMSIVSQYAANHGCSDTTMERLMLDFNSGKENYTSTLDCGTFLENIYKGELDGAQDILNYMKEQQRKTKIPAGVPASVKTANKTGELDDTENDVAVVFAPSGDYILCVMTGNLSNTGAARNLIKDISEKTYLCFEEKK